MATRPRLKQKKDVCIAVAVDKNKGSLQAFKWAVQKILSKGQSLILLHVRITGLKNDTNGDEKKDDLFLPFRCLCIQREIGMEEAIVDGVDVAKAIIQFVQDNGIGVLVLGSPSKGGLLKIQTRHNNFFPKDTIVPNLGSSDRRFRTTDVPSIVTKAAPEFCTVYVIGKEKINSVRTATSKPPRSARTLLKNDSGKSGGKVAPDEITISKTSFVSDVSSGTARSSTDSRPPISSFTGDSEMGGYSGFSGFGNGRNSYGGTDSTYSSSTLDSAKFSWSSQSQSMDEVEGEMKRLALEMKQSKSSYNSSAYNGTPKAKQKAELVEGGGEGELRYRKYSIEEIQVATDDFSNSRKIGEGGYGPVYQSVLDHTPVAIKVLRPDAVQGRSQFQKEIEVLTRMRHPNMVLLLGACPEFGCLVYEYMSNGSLEDRLLRRGDSPALPWQLRFRIAAEVATGLLFLHQTKPEPVVHRDLKPGNILLDRNFVSKIADVGLARLIPTATMANSFSNYHMTAAAGTFCYIDPEYQQTGMLGTKSDVYSLGIMFLQMITAKPPMGLTHLVQQSIENGTFSSVLDPAVRDWPVEAAMAFAKLSLSCVELRRKDRPDLGSVVLPTLEKLSEFAEQSMPSFGAGITAGLSKDRGPPSAVSLQEMAPSDLSYESRGSRASSYG